MRLPNEECRCKNPTTISTEPNQCCNCGGWLKNKFGGEQERAGRLPDDNQKLDLTEEARVALAEAHHQAVENLERNRGDDPEGRNFPYIIRQS